MNQKEANPLVKQAIIDLIAALQVQPPLTPSQQDNLTEKIILEHILPLIGPEQSLVSIIKDLLTDPDIADSHKYVLLLYLSLGEASADRVSDLHKFYYELCSHAIRQVKQKGNSKPHIFWEATFQRIYQYGMLLLVGSKSLLLGVESLGMRVSVHMFATKAREMRLGRLVRIYNCLLCIPEKYLSLKQTLYLTLLFTRWEQVRDPFGPSFFASFSLRTQSKLIRKLRSYPPAAFTQQHLLNLLKLVLGGDELLFSHFLQVKYSYQALRLDPSAPYRTDKSLFEPLRKCVLMRQGRHLFNFVVQLLLEAKNENGAVLTPVQRQAILYVCLRCMSNKYENNEELFVNLARRYLQQSNETVLQMSFRFMREEALQYLTVHKVKLLLNLFNNDDWRKVLTLSQLNQAAILVRLERIIALLVGIARKYSESSLIITCNSQQYSLQINHARSIKSAILVVSFDRLRESEPTEAHIARIYVTRDCFYDVIICFQEKAESLTLDVAPETRQRTANIIIRNNKQQLVNARKQYLRFGEGNFESLVAFSLSPKIFSICVDGAYFEFDQKSKGELSGLHLGKMAGSIRSFYALKSELQLNSFHKQWCESDRKAKFVIQNLGTQQIVYRLNSKQQPTVLDLGGNSGFSFFQTKTEFLVKGTAIKQITFMDILLQLGGLQTIFFITQRFSRSLLQFQKCEEQINNLLADFFSFLRISAAIDESAAFLDDILQCFKYLNEFLFLLIRRNRVVRESHNSALLLSIFELLVYFRRGKGWQLASSILKQKASQIEISLIIRTLANFEIWGSCSIALQLFVISQIELFIKEEHHTAALIRADLHEQLLSSLVLFLTSDNVVPHHPLLHSKLIQLCALLYEHSDVYLQSAQKLKEITGNSKQNIESFIDRDISTCLTLLRTIIKNKRERNFSQSQRSAFQIVVHYLTNNFITKKSIFNIIGKNWHCVAYSCYHFLSQLGIPDVHFLQLFSLVSIKLASMDENLDIWIYRCLQAIFSLSDCKFTICFRIISYIVSHWLFDSPRKHLIINQFIKACNNRITFTEPKLQTVKQFQEIIASMNIETLYQFTTYQSFLQLFKNVKETYFEIEPNHILKNQSQNEQKLQIWLCINKHILEWLYGQKKITQLNGPFIEQVIANIYQAQSKHYLAVASLAQIIQKLPQIRELAKNSHEPSEDWFSKYGIQGAFALIEHCQSWQVMYFLLQNGLLTTEWDLAIPSIPGEHKRDFIGGTLGYYLASSSSPIELYVIFVIILHRQLSNNVSLLATQANIAIFQYSLQYLLENSKENSNKDSHLNVNLIIMLLKQLLKSLNSRVIIRIAAASKQFEKILGTYKKSEIDWRKKKSQEIFDTLSKAANKIQIVLEEDKVDRDVASFLQHIFDKLTLIHEKDDEEEMLSIVNSLLEDMKNKQLSHTQTQLRKLSLAGVRFFQLAREHFLANHHTNLFDKQRDGKSQTKTLNIQQKEMQIFQNYIELLTQKFDKLLMLFSERGRQSETTWENLLMTNEHWFELQDDVDDVTTKFYELDEKEVGPYGFYKLNIRPVRTALSKLPYPRRQEYLDMMTRKREEAPIEQPIGPRLTITNVSTSLFTSLAEEYSSSKDKETLPRQSTLTQLKNKPDQRQLYCELITKRGVYAGILRKKKAILQFVFTGHGGLPQDKQYQMSTNKCHRIEQLSEWEEKQIGQLRFSLPGTRIMTRRYIMRYTAFEIFLPMKHRTYFFNLFYPKILWSFLTDIQSLEVQVIDDRSEAFIREGYTQKWQKGEISNFEYLCMVNRYSGRSYNDLAQYPVMPWVICNYQGKQGFKEINRDFYKNSSNFRDLSIPSGKLEPEKFNKLKARLREVDASDRQIRFLYGSMYSNPTVLYNFFIRLEPYTSLHWQHQGRKIDHADRLFSGVAEQFSTVLTSSSDNKELTPEFYYWPQFLRNRNRIELGRKQRGDDVDDVVLPAWARSPQEFVFKMREALQSNIASAKLHEWIDLIFGYKSPLSAAEEHDNLFHYQCYEHDIFNEYQTDNQIKIAQISISQFGQIPQQIFFKGHPPRHLRRQMDIDLGRIVYKSAGLMGFQFNEMGVLLWSEDQAAFCKVAIPGLFHCFEWTREQSNKGKTCFLLSIINMKCLSFSSGVLKLYEKGRSRMDRSVPAKCLEAIGAYIFYGHGSKIGIIKVGERFDECGVLYGHRDEVVLLQTDYYLDVVVSVDRSGYVLVHELTELRFLRAFQIGANFEEEEYRKLRVCIHRMGYFIFLDHRQTLWIFNYMGQLILQQDFELRAARGDIQEQRITDLHLLNHESSLLLIASSRGAIYQVNFLDVIRFRDAYPFKTYSRLELNILSNVRRKGLESVWDKPIKQISVARTSAEKGPINQLLVLYQGGQFVCYTEQKQIGKQLQSNERLKSMGFF